MQGSRFEAETPLGRLVNGFEETAIAVILGLMTLITFANVVLRYAFNSSLIWGLETTEYLFAWLVLFGMSYCVKVNAHLGVDALINIVPRTVQRLLVVLAGLVCLAYAFLMMKGAWDQFANFANLPQTTGHWFPTGLQEMKPWDNQGYTPTEQLPLPDILRGPIEWLFLPEGEEPYEKLPLVIPYMILPIGCALLLFRFCQAFLHVLRGRRQALIVSHEAEDALEELAAQRGDRG
ncbi:MAG: TRAP transporter small permease [Pseudomonadota bacterium]